MLYANSANGLNLSPTDIEYTFGITIVVQNNATTGRKEKDLHSKRSGTNDAGTGVGATNGWDTERF
jgi:hypothetical protein